MGSRSPESVKSTSWSGLSHDVCPMCSWMRLVCGETTDNVCPFGRTKIAYSTHVSGAVAGNWEKFSTSNKRTSARPHWSRYRLCAKLRKRGQAESMDEMMLRSRAWLLLVIECEWEGSGETLFSPCTFYSRGRVSEMERKGNQLIRRS